MQLLGICLSVCPIQPPLAAVAGLLLWGWRAADIDQLLHSQWAVGQQQLCRSSCGQCHVVSWNRKLNIEQRLVDICCFNGETQSLSSLQDVLNCWDFYSSNILCWALSHPLWHCPRKCSSAVVDFVMQFLGIIVACVVLNVLRIQYNTCEWTFSLFSSFKIQRQRR